CVEDAFPSSDDILFAVDGIADGAAGIRAAQIGVPKKLAGASVQRDKISFHAAAEYKVAGSGQNAIFGIADHFEIPFLVAGFGVDGADSSVTFVFRLIGGNSSGA